MERSSSGISPRIATGAFYPADRIGEVSSFAFSADSKRVSAFGNEGKVLTWGTSGGELLSSRSIPVPAKLAWAELSRDGATLATLSEDRSCQVWDVASGSLIRSIENATTAGGMQLSHDGKWLSAPVTDAGKMRRIRVWNTENGGEFQSRDANSVEPWDFSPARRRLASVSAATGSLRVEDLASGRVVTAGGRSDVGAIKLVEFSEDGTMVATTGIYQTITIWDADTLQARLAVPAFSGGTSYLAFSPDGRTLAASNGLRMDIKIWDILTGQEIFVPVPHHSVTGLMFSPDGSFLAIRGWAHDPNRRCLCLFPAPRE